MPGQPEKQTEKIVKAEIVKRLFNIYYRLFFFKQLTAVKFLCSDKACPALICACTKFSTFKNSTSESLTPYVNRNNPR